MLEMQEMWIRSLCWEDPLEKGMATHSSILAWRIPWTEETDRLQSIKSHRVRHNWSDLAHARKRHQRTSPIMAMWIHTWEGYMTTRTRGWLLGTQRLLHPHPANKMRPQSVYNSKKPYSANNMDELGEMRSQILNESTTLLMHWPRPAETISRGSS